MSPKRPVVVVARKHPIERAQRRFGAGLRALVGKPDSAVMCRLEASATPTGIGHFCE